LKTYNYCDDVWTFQLENATFKSDGEEIPVGSVSVVACAAKKEGSSFFFFLFFFYA